MGHLSRSGAWKFTCTQRMPICLAFLLFSTRSRFATLRGRTCFVSYVCLCLSGAVQKQRTITNQHIANQTNNDLLGMQPQPTRNCSSAPRIGRVNSLQERELKGNDLAMGRRCQSGTMSCAVSTTGLQGTAALSECAVVAVCRSAGRVGPRSTRQTAKAMCQWRWPTTTGTATCRRSLLGWTSSGSSVPVHRFRGPLRSYTS